MSSALPFAAAAFDAPSLFDFASASAFDAASLAAAIFFAHSSFPAVTSALLPAFAFEAFFRSSCSAFAAGAG